MTKEKVFFNPGDVVRLRQGNLIDHAPRMLVIGTDNKRFIEDGKDTIKGIRCRWFTSTGELQEATFNTKDLELVD